MTRTFSIALIAAAAVAASGEVWAQNVLAAAQREVERPAAEEADAKTVGWWDKDIAKSWHREAQIGERENFRFFREKRQREQPTPENVARHDKAPAEQAPQGDLLARFGDPNEDLPILGEEKAPRPYKAMLAALEEGNDEMAAAYARQYVRYVAGVQARVARTTSLIGAAMKREGMLSEQAARNWSILPGDEKLFAEATAELEREKERVALLDEATKSLLREAQAQEGFGNLDFVSENPDEATIARQQIEREEENAAQLRQQTRARYAGKVPVDPRGQVQVYFFFRPQDGNAEAMARVVERLHREFVEDERVQIAGLTLEDALPVAIQNFRRASRATFRIKTGAKLARAVGVSRSPTIGIISMNTGKAFYDEGVKSYPVVEELVRMAQGE